MRICHLNLDDGDGGATRAALRLHKGLLQAGQESEFYVPLKRRQEAGIKQLEFDCGYYAKARRALRRLRIKLEQPRAHSSSGYEAFMGVRSQFGAELADALPSCDVVNLHRVSGLIDYESFLASVSPRTPIVWTLHDMNPMTGGCSYDAGCRRFTAACGLCPQLGSGRMRDWSFVNLRLKRKMFTGMDARHLTLVSPSRWLAGEVSNSAVLGGIQVRVIPNGVNTDLYTPRDKRLARQVLELPEQAKIILFVANSVGNLRKGFALLAEVVERLSTMRNLCLVSVGLNQADLKVPFVYRHLGQINTEGILSLVYSAADLFVIPSLQDNLPNTVLEAMSCGLPVAGFDTGGIPDSVRPGVTGELAPVGDVEVLSEIVNHLLCNGELLNVMGRECRRIAVAEYGIEKQACAYTRLYSELLGWGAGGV